MCTSTPPSGCVLPNSVEAPGMARSFARESVCHEHGREAEAAVTLLANELVTDAVLVGEAPLSLTMECRTSEIAIAVVQPGPVASVSETPHRRLSMLLIDKVSREWGVDATANVTRHWCRVPTGNVPARTGGRGSLVAEGSAFGR